ncbi:MAG: glycoside hydrolase family 32 protein [Chitinophagaceae bacterium]|nr:glycoside hydrolase family 32 protein [Chitinophagaceae bacterium]
MHIKKYVFYIILFLKVNFTAFCQTEIKAIQNNDFQTFPSYLDIGYNQTLRPQFHFTSLKNWNNDPNGLVWYAGEYHMYFQHNPLGVKWGNMTWGHAVSKDLIHWQQLPHAILPFDKEGGIFSGTAVIDHFNQLQKQKDTTKTIIAFFTHSKKISYQAAAYSTDKGRTFTLINNGKAVVPNQGFDNGERDPKVFWYEPSKMWVMVLWVKRGAKEGTAEQKSGKVLVLNSSNLIDWKVVSQLNRDWVYECMDLVELTVDGNENEKRWLIYDASFDYEIGSFNGREFVSDKKYYLGDLGKNFYAAQSYNNSPDGRAVMIGWMNGGDNVFLKGEMPFNQQMSFPTTMELKSTPDGLRLYRWPVKEIESLYSKSYSYRNKSSKSLYKKLEKIKAELIDLSMEFLGNSNLKLNVRGLDVVYDPILGIITYEKTTIPAPKVNGLVKLRILLDRTSIEIFVNEGAGVATNYAVPNPENKNISVESTGNEKIKQLTIHELKSIWSTF